MVRLLPYGLITLIGHRFAQIFRGYILHILCLNLILMIILYYSFAPSPNLSPTSPTLFRYHLRPQNNSLYNFVKFRDLDKLTNLCENMTTIECLHYLQHHQSDYFETLSSDEVDTFKNAYCSEKNKMLFHTFWNDPYRLDDPFLRLHIESYLYTQNRQCSYLIIWTLPFFNDNHQMNGKYQIYEPYLQIRSLLPFIDDLHQVGVHIGSHWTWLPWEWFLPPWAIVSDAVRFVILNKLGGMYTDVDVLLLRDFQPLFAHEFAYRWSSTNEFNTAVLRLFPRSTTSSFVVDYARENRSPYIFFPTSLRSYSLPSSFKRLPCILFDPLWLVADHMNPITMKAWQLTDDSQVFATVFKRENEISRQGRTIFNGAFAFHWHSSHKAGIFEYGSYMHQWSQFLNSKLYENFK